MPSEYPHIYTPAELEAIARSVGRDKLTPLAGGKLQEAVVAYQWASLTERWDSLVEEEGVTPRSTNKRRREQLQNIIRLCEEGVSDEVGFALNELDGPTSQSLGPLEQSNLQDVKSAAERALRTIKVRGPDRKRARRQFIRRLCCTFALATGKRPGRRVHAQEYGPLRDFVRAALEPFNATMGCEADIKAALRSLKTGW
jgi:hypothetical protein